jgi:hypothetical protein
MWSAICSSGNFRNREIVTGGHCSQQLQLWRSWAAGELTDDAAQAAAEAAHARRQRRYARYVEASEAAAEAAHARNTGGLP